MRVGSLTDVGKVRPNNEDAHGLASERGVFVVADGMGGHQAGEVASQQAVDVILEMLRDWDGTLPADEALVSAVSEANAQIEAASRMDRDLKGMGTTVVAAIVQADSFTVAHVGDSRAYLLRDGELRCLTEDHSMVLELVRAGVITQEQAATHPYRSAISRSLGQFREVETDTHTEPWLPGDHLLLCTDGLTRFVPEPEIRDAILRHPDPQDGCRELVDLALAQGGRDNVTVILISHAG